MIRTQKSTLRIEEVTGTKTDETQSWHKLRDGGESKVNVGLLVVVKKEVTEKLRVT